MRSTSILGFSLIALGTLTIAHTALAKDTATKWTEIVPTNINDFDSVFNKVGAIDTTVTTQTTAMTTAHTSVNTVLGVAEGSPLSDAIKGAVAAAGGKLSLDTSGGVPHLKAAGDAPDAIKADAKAVNGLIDVGTATIKTCTDLVPQAEGLVTAVKDFPAKLKGMDPAVVLKATGPLGKDMKATSETPARIKALSDAAVQIYTDIKGAFGS